MKTLYRTPEPGAVGLFRNSEPTIHTKSSAVRSTSGPATHASLDAKPGTLRPAYPSDELPVATSGTDFFGRTPYAPPKPELMQPEPPDQEEEKTRKKRYLLLL